MKRGEKGHFLKWRCKSDAPYTKMKKLYTVGEIAKKYKVSLSEVYLWSSKIKFLIGGRWGRQKGIIPIENDCFARNGFPESLVKIFPKTPGKRMTQKLKEELKIYLK